MNALAVDTVHALHLALIEQFGEDAPDVLYRTGYEWALQEMVRRHRLALPPGGAAASPGKLQSVLESWWREMAEAGWGRATFDVGPGPRGVVLVELQAGAVAPAFAGADQPVCHLYAGLFAGALSFCARAERHAAELQCIACGATTCIFAVGSGPEVDAAESSRQHGVAAAEIMRRLR